MTTSTTTVGTTVCRRPSNTMTTSTTTVGTTVCRWPSNNWHYKYIYPKQTGFMEEGHNRQWSEDQCGKNRTSVNKGNLLPIELNGEELKNVDHFKYLGLVIDKKGTIDRDVDLRVRAAWSSWRKFTGILYDRKIPLGLKAKVYEAIIRLALTYGSECWAMKMTNKRKIATTEMRMLRGMLGVSRRNHMWNEEIRRILHISPIDEVAVFVGLGMSRDGIQTSHPQSDGAGNTRYQAMRAPQEDMTGVDVTQDVALDQNEWMRRTRPTPREKAIKVSKRWLLL